MAKVELSTDATRINELRKWINTAEAGGAAAAASVRSAGAAASSAAHATSGAANSGSAVRMIVPIAGPRMDPRPPIRMAMKNSTDRSIVNASVERPWPPIASTAIIPMFGNRSSAGRKVLRMRADSSDSRRMSSAHPVWITSSRWPWQRNVPGARGSDAVSFNLCA